MTTFNFLIAAYYLLGYDFINTIFSKLVECFYFPFELPLYYPPVAITYYVPVFLCLCC